MTTDGPPVLPPSTRVDTIDSTAGRILCIADIRGNVSLLNKLAAEHNAKAIIHTGDFGFFERSSFSRVGDRALKHLVHYSNCLSQETKSKLTGQNSSISPFQLRQMFSQQPNAQQQQQTNGSSSKPPGLDPEDLCITEFPKLLTGEITLQVPVYAVWGACEDIAVLERLRVASPGPITIPSGPITPATATKPSSAEPNWSIPNLTVLSESCSRVLNIGGLKLRLFGLGGACVPHKMFDNGEGQATIAGGSGTMWTTMLQIGELIDTAQRVYDSSETRLLVTHASPGKDGLLAQVALALQADFTVSGSLHFRYGASYSDWCVFPDTEVYRNKFNLAKSAFAEVWDTVKSQVNEVIDEGQRKFLDNALAVTARVPCEPARPGGPPQDEPAFKNTWNWNLPDVNFGTLVLDVTEGRVSSEMKNLGFNYAYRMNSSGRAPPKGPTEGSKAQTPVPTGPRASRLGSSTNASAAPTPPPQTKPQPSSSAAVAAAPAAPAPQTASQQAKPVSKPHAQHRKEGSQRDSKDSSTIAPSPAPAASSAEKTVPESKDSSDRPASRFGDGSRRGSQHFKRGSSRTNTPPPATAVSDASADIQQHASSDSRGGRGGRGGRGRGSRGRGDFRGRGRGVDSGSKDSSHGDTSAPASSAPASKAE